MASSYNVQSLFEVKNLVAVITGGGSGLGKVIAHALAANGAKAVYVLGRRKEALAQTRDSSSNPDVVHPIACDVTSKDSLAAAADRVRNDIGYCHVVFANSGIATAGLGDAIQQAGTLSAKSLQEKLWAPSMDEFTKTFHVNVTGAFYTAVAFLDLLDEANKLSTVTQKSQVIITASIAGFSRMPSAGFAYGPSKASVTHLTKQLSTVLAPLKIRVNAIAPGIFPSDMTDSTFLKDSVEPRQEGGFAKGLVPLERCGTEERWPEQRFFLQARLEATSMAMSLSSMADVFALYQGLTRQTKHLRRKGDLWRLKRQTGQSGLKAKTVELAATVAACRRRGVLSSRPGPCPSWPVAMRPSRHQKPRHIGFACR